MNSTIVTIVISAVTLLLAIVGGGWLNQRSLERQIDQQNRVLEANLAALRADFNTAFATVSAKVDNLSTKVDLLTERVAKIERQLEAIFKPVLPR